MTEVLLRTIEPVDVVHLRGNRLFEGTGDGVAVMPPWPSLFAGALRSRMLADERWIEGYLAGDASKARAELRAALGPSHAARGEGSFRVVFTGLEVELDGRRVFCVQAPQDLVCFGQRDGRPEEVVRVSPTKVGEVTRGLVQSDAPASARGRSPLRPPAAPLLRTARRDKPVKGWWLVLEGARAWQEGKTPRPEHFVHASRLWSDDPRLGIALDRDTRTVREGFLYVSRAIALRPGVRFAVGVTGVDDGLLPRDGLVRLGGDGRGGAVAVPPPLDAGQAPWQRLPGRDRFTVWLSTPGAFAGGWRLPGLGDDGVWRPVEGFAADLIAAAVPRHEVVSGWSLADGARGAPKPALRVVPTGAVYWMQRREGAFEALRPTLAGGLVEASSDGDVRSEGDATSIWRSRAIEGFGSVWYGDMEA
jgi:CRISPR-associated protein Cmr3